MASISWSPICKTSLFHFFVLAAGFRAKADAHHAMDRLVNVEPIGCIKGDSDVAQSVLHLLLCALSWFDFIKTGGADRDAVKPAVSESAECSA